MTEKLKTERYWEKAQRSVRREEMVGNVAEAWPVWLFFAFCGIFAVGLLIGLLELLGLM